MTKIKISNGSDTEVHDVHSIERGSWGNIDRKHLSGDHEPGMSYTIVRGIDPSDTNIIPSTLVWLSGSMAAPTSEPGRFPLVYITEKCDIEIQKV